MCVLQARQLVQEQGNEGKALQIFPQNDKPERRRRMKALLVQEQGKTLTTNQNITHQTQHYIVYA